MSKYLAFAHVTVAAVVLVAFVTGAPAIVVVPGCAVMVAIVFAQLFFTQRSP